jgi:photosystem II stability/assembly factor-like uncharacterized protein
LPTGVGGVTGISCPSPSLCFATENDSVLTTADAGATWTPESLSPDPPTLAAIACPSASSCYAVGGTNEGAAILGTIDGGKSWTVLAIPTELPGAGQTTELTAIACPSVTVCYAINDQADYLVTTDAGRTWSGLSGLSAGGYGAGIACPSVTTCVTVGESGILASTDAGASWVRQTEPLPTYGFATARLSGVACPTTTDCYATGAIGDNDSDGGGEVIATTDAGATWSATVQTPYFGGLAGISCPSPAICFAGDNDTPTDGDVAGTIVRTENAGTTWTNESLPFGLGPLSDLACPSPTSCFATSGTGVVATSDGGSTWDLESLPPGSMDSTAIACPTVSSCFVSTTNLSDTNSQIVATSDAGHSWHLLTELPTDDNPSALICPSPTTCLAVGSDILLTTDSGATWTPQPLPGTGEPLDGIVCPSALICYAVGYGTVITTNDSGRTWTAAGTLPAGLDPVLSGIACPSASTCITTGEDMNCHGSDGPCSPGTYAVDVTEDAAASWRGHRLPSDITLTAIACPSATLCDAVAFDANADDYTGGAAGNVLLTTDLGDTWSTEPLPSGTGQLNSVTCPLPTTCYAVGEGTGYVGGLILKNAGG